MAKKFKFGAEGLLKLRNFKEKSAKIELGRIYSEISQIKEKIESLKIDIDDSYREQEGLVKSKVNAQMLQFFPIFVEGKNREIEQNKVLLVSLEREADLALKELQKARGDVKLLENLKDKKLKIYKKDKLKKEQETLEDILTMRNKSSQGAEL